MATIACGDSARLSDMAMRFWGKFGDGFCLRGQFGNRWTEDDEIGSWACDGMLMRAARHSREKGRCNRPGKKAWKEYLGNVMEVNKSSRFRESRESEWARPQVKNKAANRISADQCGCLRGSSAGRGRVKYIN